MKSLRRTFLATGGVFLFLLSGIRKSLLPDGTLRLLAGAASCVVLVTVVDGVGVKAAHDLCRDDDELGWRGKVAT